ncbi:hypothetical protein ACFYNV_24630 [Streptomyces albidoflavus]|uniref:hypothetical protein n=1 Tax=Streptomyces albidoflavus TaxID=1886 RepID=UPI0027AADD84|nr:hypothetical protein OIM90_31565 [Streptomyces sp. AD16]
MPFEVMRSGSDRRGAAQRSMKKLDAARSDVSELEARGVDFREDACVELGALIVGEAGPLSA